MGWVVAKVCAVRNDNRFYRTSEHGAPLRKVALQPGDVGVPAGYPLHLLTLGIVAVIQAVALYVNGEWLIFGNNDAYHFLLNLLFVSGWWQSTSMSFNAVIWSVSAEILAYALFWMTLTWLLRWGIALPLAIATCARLTVALNIAPDSLGVLLCVYFFFIGTAMFVALSAAPTPKEKALIGAGCVCAIGFGSIVKWEHAVWELMRPGLFGAFILLGYWIDSVLSLRVRKLLSNAGDLSYGIYLWHMPILLVLCLSMPSALLLQVTRQGWFILVFLAMAVAIAWVGFRFFERPARDLIRQLAHPRIGSHPARPD